MGPFTINGRRFDIGRIDLAMPAGATEVGVSSMPPAWPTRCTFMVSTSLFSA